MDPVAFTIPVMTTSWDLAALFGPAAVIALAAALVAVGAVLVWVGTSADPAPSPPASEPIEAVLRPAA